MNYFGRVMHGAESMVEIHPHSVSSQNFTIDWRLGDGTKTGKIAARNTVTTQLQNYIIANMSEMFNPIFSSPYGTTAANEGALTATVAVLQVNRFMGCAYRCLGLYGGAWSYTSTSLK